MKKIFLILITIAVFFIPFKKIISQTQDEKRILYIQTVKKRIDEIKQTIPNIKSPIKEYTQIAHLYLEIEEYDNAVEYIIKALSIEPQNANLYYTLALIYEKKNDNMKAIESWQNVLKFSKNKKINEIALKHIQILQSQK